MRNLSKALPIFFCSVLFLGAAIDAAQARPKPRLVTPTQIASAPATHEVQWGGKWWRATVLARRPGFTKIHYVGWSAAYDSWVENKDVRPLSMHHSSAPTVSILWGGRWWPGTVLQRRSGLIKVHYTGWSSVWDQWVEPSRVRTR